MSNDTTIEPTDPTTRPRLGRILAGGAVALALTLGAAACSDDDTADIENEVDETEQELEDTGDDIEEELDETGDEIEDEADEMEDEMEDDG